MDAFSFIIIIAVVSVIAWSRYEDGKVNKKRKERNGSN